MDISRFMEMESVDVQVEFLTPTYIGGADQEAELRLAPFKSLLRQWWRIRSPLSDYKTLLEKESDLFGSATDQGNSGASRVRLSLKGEHNINFLHDIVDIGTPPTTGRLRQIPNAEYLGFGLFALKNRASENRTYIVPGGTCTLSVQFPKTALQEMKQTLDLINAFGTIGSRSRNGFGSIRCTYPGQKPLTLTNFPIYSLSTLLGPGHTYPQGFGEDSRGFLCWQTKESDDYRRSMELVANAYRRVRKATNLNRNDVSERHILGYPVKDHPIADWGGNNGRMPSQLRLAVKKTEGGKFLGLILHIPHGVPLPWPSTILPQQEVWEQIHSTLDEDKSLKRWGGMQ